MSKYNVDDAWPIDEPTNVEDCLKKLVRLSPSGKAIECHGAYQNFRCILSSFDFRFEKKSVCKADRKMLEKNLLESFVKKADPHFSSGENQLIELARLKWDTLYNTGTVFVGRHYCLPTRCVDWTTDPLIALFFACRRYFDKPGVVWWMERPIKQKAHIILSGQYNVHHDEAIHRLGVQKCGRIVISSQMKSDLLNKLNRWGINGATLGIGDSCVETIAADIANDLI